jgi:hypothetical protein
MVGEKGIDFTLDDSGTLAHKCFLRQLLSLMETLIHREPLREREAKSGCNLNTGNTGNLLGYWAKRANPSKDKYAELRMIAQALNKIRDQELHLDEGYDSLNAYLEEKLGIDRHTAGHICEAYQTIKTLEAAGLSLLPGIQSQQSLSLYLLVFKHEPLFKVGLSMDLLSRCRDLGLNRFDLPASFLVQAFDQIAIGRLERNLKTFFWPYQSKSAHPLPNGNTETFHRSALPRMLQAIETFAQTFPLAGFQTQQDLSSLISPSAFRAPAPVAGAKGVGVTLDCGSLG